MSAICIEQLPVTGSQSADAHFATAADEMRQMRSGQRRFGQNDVTPPHVEQTTELAGPERPSSTPQLQINSSNAHTRLHKSSSIETIKLPAQRMTKLSSSEKKITFRV